MTKKKVWTAGCMMMMVFLVCTVLSIHIQRLMRIDVEVTGGISNKEDEAMQTARFLFHATKQKSRWCFVWKKGKDYLGRNR